jgi:hypothetical protein
MQPTPRLRALFREQEIARSKLFIPKLTCARCSKTV